MIKKPSMFYKESKALRHTLYPLVVAIVILTFLASIVYPMGRSKKLSRLFVIFRETFIGSRKR